MDDEPQGSAPADFKKSRRQKASLKDPLKEDRQPPHSVEAEQGVLGCVLLSPSDCIGLCIEKFSSSEVFYDLRHRTIYETMLAMQADGVPIDTITLQQELKDLLQLEGVGGLVYLASLPDAVPSAANVDYYIEIVREKFTLRKAIGLATEVVTRAYEHQGEVDELVDQLTSDILQLSNSTQQITTLQRANQLVPQSIAWAENALANQGQMSGIATGFVDFDTLTNGLEGGQMIVIAARPSTGKAQPTDEPVLTPTGFRPIGELSVGDSVIGLDGKPKSVIAIHPQGQKEVFRVNVSDGTSTRCCGEHLWLTMTRDERRYASCGTHTVKSTSTIASTIHRPDGGVRNHALPLHEPVSFVDPTIVMPIHPWLLGALIGDGNLCSPSISFCKPEDDLIQKVASLIPEEDAVTPIKMGVRIRRKEFNGARSETSRLLKLLDLRVFSEHKFIPEIYKISSIEDRLMLLQGLLDTDGYVSGPSVEYSTSSERLKDDVVELARGLGFIVAVSDRIPSYTHNGETKSGLRSWRVLIHLRIGHMMPVTSLKHLSRVSLKERKFHRSITSIVPDGQSECVCITVDDSMYLTSGFIPTHNSSLVMNMADYAAVNLHLPVAAFSLEMSALSLMNRCICSRARVPMNLVKRGQMADVHYGRFASASAQLRHSPLFIDDESGTNILKLQAKARRYHQQYGIRLIVIDYLQLMTAKAESRQHEITIIAQGIKSLAKELNVPIIVAAQLNREMEKDKKRRKPRLSDIRESGSTEQEADIVGLLYQPEIEPTEDGGPEPDNNVSLVNLIIAKHRGGEAGSEIPLTFFKSYTRFESASHATT